MDFQNFAESLPKYNLPEELCREILSRLPVKSLLRFCCVSKSWLSLIKCPDFHRLHLQNFKNNRDETHLLAVQGMSQYCVVRCSDTFETNSGTLLTLGRFRRRRGSVVNTIIKCSVDGLVVLRSQGNRLRIWNPSIRKFHDIPALPETETSLDTPVESDIGLGYDPFVKDYKYVKTVRVNRNQLPLVAVYTLGADSWKIIPFQGNEGFNFDCIFGPSQLTVYLQGMLYLLVYHRSETRGWELGSFDMSNEVFRTVSVPDDTIHDWPEVSINLFRNGCSSLALFLYDIRIDNLTMWVFESKSMCWTKVYKLGSRVPRCRVLYLKKNRDLLMLEELPGYLDLAHDVGLAWSFNLETKEEKIPQRQNEEFISEVYRYIESWVLFK